MKEKKKREREAKTTAKAVGKFYLEGNVDGQREEAGMKTFNLKH